MAVLNRRTRKPETWQVEYNPGGKPGRKYSKPKTLKDGSVPEKVIQKQILDWLTDAGILHWRQNSGVVFAGNRMIRLGEEGLPDIVCVLPPNGRFLGLEVKSAKGSLRPKQKEFMETVRGIGGLYYVVRSLEAAKQAVAIAYGTNQLEKVWD